MRIFIVLLLLFLSNLLYSKNPDYWKFRKDQEIYIETQTIYDLRVNGEYVGKSSLIERSFQKVVNIANNSSANIKASTFIIESIKNSFKERTRIKKEYQYNLEKKTDGSIVNKSGKVGINNFPIFPENDLKVGEAYVRTSDLIIPVLNTDLPEIIISLTMVYRYLGLEDGTGLSLYSAKGIVNQDSSNAVFQKAKYLKVIGFTDNLVKFDRKEGIINSIEEYFDWTFILYDNTVIEMSGTSITYCKTPPPLELDKFNKLTEKIEKSNIENKKNNNNDSENDKSTIKLNKDLYVTITLENVEFNKDSAELTDNEKKRIDKIANNLKENNIKKLIIIGHSADVGNKDAQLKLSEERAKTVTDYLCNVHKFSSNNVSFMGKGGSEPIDTNATEEGRKRNRRVEFVIIPE